MRMWLFKQCPNCGGDLLYNKNGRAPEYTCLQCSRIFSSDTIQLLAYDVLPGSRKDHPTLIRKVGGALESVGRGMS